MSGKVVLWSTYFYVRVLVATFYLKLDLLLFLSCSCRLGGLSHRVERQKLMVNSRERWFYGERLSVKKNQEIEMKSEIDSQSWGIPYFIVFGISTPFIFDIIMYLYLDIHYSYYIVLYTYIIHIT